MDTGFGNCADTVLSYLRDVDFANEYFYMNNTQRLKFLNEILKILGEFADYGVNEDD